MPQSHTNHTCFYSPAAGHQCPLAGTHCAYPRRDGQVELGWLYTEIGFLHQELNPRPITHSSTNWARRRVTLLIDANALPLSQTATMCSGYDLCHPGWPKIWFYILAPVTMKIKSNHRWIRQLVHTCQVHLHSKFDDHRPVTCTDNTHTSIFYDDLTTSQVGQGDRYFVVQSGFISSSVHARLQVSGC